MPDSPYEMTVFNPSQLDGWDYLEIYGIKKAIDLCKKFMDLYAIKSKENDTSKQLGRLLMMIERFAQKYPMIPERLRDPMKILRKGKLAHDLIHEEIALEYVMDVYTELLTIDKRKGVPADYYLNEWRKNDGTS